jgi:hypothetical protein
VGESLARATGPRRIDEFVQVARAAACQHERMWKLTLSVSLLAALAVGAAADAPPTPAPQRTTAMPEFALLFRATRAVTPEELPRRNAAARDWALARRKEGKLSFASPLEDAGFTVTRQATSPIAPERPVASVLVIQAPDLDGAVALAKGHPGLAFGTEIEVRPVKAGANPPAAGSPPERGK